MTLEELCAQGILKGYGIAAWSGFEETEGAAKLVPSDILDMMCGVGSGHHFRAIQLPLSLVKIKPISAYFQKRGPIDMALREKVDIFGSSPLHGGLLPPVLKSAFFKQLGALLTAAEACLLFAKSVPGISATFTSPTSVQQRHQRFDVSKLAPLSEEKRRSIVGLLTKHSGKYRDAS
ncbi:hypothetical protein [Candidatus Hepatobacter penaei]|uniref:hypothetical protein n=1 Tax=Candidatus Hepatobacter penaei TaxID=1274402 RepID=UPI000697BE0A|nr:hypothetical protein [Candidatus Hepatobacter penaei]